MIRCQITDRHSAGGVEPLVRSIARNLMDGIDLVQIREKDLTARDLAALTTRVLALPNPHGSRILVNTRADVAIACGAHGVHLPAGSPSPERFRAIAPPDFLVSVSCHTEEELLAADRANADFALLSPIFLTQTVKTGQTPLGLDGLARLTARVHLPVLALGGVSQKNAALCLRSGAAGMAGISMFQ